LAGWYPGRKRPEFPAGVEADFEEVVVLLLMVFSSSLSPADLAIAAQYLSVHTRNHGIATVEATFGDEPPEELRQLANDDSVLDSTVLLSTQETSHGRGSNLV
jgi:hypothetical protein